jgi:sporulation protein YlmC with PRC-barrel domain
MRNDLIIACSAVALLTCPHPWQDAIANDKIDLTTWDQSLAQRGRRATELFDTKVYGEGGEEIGEVENFYIDRDGQVTRIIIESGGVFDIGDVHLAVPWNEVKMWPDEDGILVPINDDNVPDFSLFREDPAPGVAAWRATDLIHDLAYLAGGDQYGMVEDLIISPEGMVEAVVVGPDGGFPSGDRRAYPWYGPGYDPALNRYELPYDQREIEVLGPFDYQAMQN